MAHVVKVRIKDAIFEIHMLGGLVDSNTVNMNNGTFEFLLYAVKCIYQRRKLSTGYEYSIDLINPLDLEKRFLRLLEDGILFDSLTGLKGGLHHIIKKKRLQIVAS